MAGSKVKFKIYRKGIGQLLRSPEVEAELLRRARKVAAAAGDGHEIDSQRGPKRARASVRTATFEAILLERRTRNLTRAFDQARD